MIRLLSLGLLILAVGGFLATAQDPAAKKKEPVPEKVDLNAQEEKAPAKKDDQASEDKAAELITRIHKNMEASRERLDKKDPGDTTRQVQRDIVGDLDELIEQQKKQDQQNQSQSSSSTSASRRKLSQKQSSQSKQEKNQEQKSAAPKKEQPDPHKQPAGQKKDLMDLAQKKPEDKGGAKDKTEQGGKDKKDKKDQLAKSGGQGGSSKKDKNTLADLYRDIWGHLPATKRQEMDAYARERFMRNYEDLLRQYYRTIAEQDRRSEGD